MDPDIKARAIADRNDGHQQFLRAWDRIESSIEFDKDWMTGLRGYDNAMAVPLAPGQVVKSVATLGAKIILIGTPVGTAVLYEYEGGSNGASIFYNVDESLAILFNGGLVGMSGRDVMRVMDCATPERENIGHELKQIIERYNDLQRADFLKKNLKLLKEETA